MNELKLSPDLKGKKIKFEMFPNFLVRMGNGNFNNIKKLNFINTLEKVDSYLLLEERKNNIKDRLCDYLYHKIKLITDVKTQNILLNIKRDIYNDRLIKNENVASIEFFLNNDYLNLFSEYQDFLQELNNKKEALNNLYKIEEAHIRFFFKDLIDNTCLKNGLLLSSGVMHEELNKFLNTSDDKGKKTQSLELSLLKYISRIYTKTTPFGLFTNIGYGAMREGDDFYFLSEKEEYYTQEKVRLNNFIFKKLNNIWFNHSKYNRFFYLKKNITLKKLNSQFEFLHCVNGASAIQTIEQDEFLNYLFELSFNEEKFNISSLTAYLINQSFFDEHELKSLEDYIYKLIKAGFLEYNIGVIGSDPLWLKKMLLLFTDLNQIPNSNFNETIDFLNQLQTLFQEFEVGLTNERKEILDALSITINNYTSTLEKEIDQAVDEDPKDKEKRQYNFSKIDILKIDNKLDNALFFNAKVGKSITSKLDELVCLVRNFDYFKKDREIVKCFFLEKYASNSKISLLQFYRDFFKDYKLPKIADAKKDSNIILNSEHDFEDVELRIKTEFNNFYTIANQFFFNAFEKIENSTELNISLNEIKKIIFSNSPIKPIKGSWGSHVQVYSETNKMGEIEVKAVLNAVFPGYGKLSSRFLYLFDDAYSNIQYDWNLKLGNKDEMLIENKDNNYFNANIHPKMLPFELYTPGISRTNLEYEISIGDFFVSFDETTNSLKVKHKETQKLVSFFDLGFELDERRSNLFWFINLFSFSEWPNIFPLLNSINYGYSKRFHEQDSGVVFSPRIICDNSLILQRKTWVIKKNILPFQNQNESFLEYFLKVKKWQKELLIPDNIFISIPKHNSEEIKKVKMIADDYKPLYISLKSPIFIKLFLKIINRTDNFIKITEMLPNLEVDGKENFCENYPKEFLFQWYNYDE